MLQLDDLLDKKKEPPQALDLSRSVITSEEEFRRLLEKVPEYKIRPEKVRPEDVKMREKDFTFHVRRKELRRQHEFSYADPCPPEMRSVRLEDLSSVSIEWKMLTSLRPKTRQEEDMFSRLVEMSRLHLRTAAATQRGAAAEKAALVRRGKNRAGILETRVVVCDECGDEFCTGTACAKIQYDAFARADAPEATPKAGARERGRTKAAAKKTAKPDGKKPRSSRSRKRSGSSKHKKKPKRPSKGKSRSLSRSLSRSPSKGTTKRASKSAPKFPPKTYRGTRSLSESPSRIPSKAQPPRPKTKRQSSSPTKSSPTKSSNKSGSKVK